VLILTSLSRFTKTSTATKTAYFLDSCKCLCGGFNVEHCISYSPTESHMRTQYYYNAINYDIKTTIGA